MTPIRPCQVVVGKVERFGVIELLALPVVIACVTLLFGATAARAMGLLVPRRQAANR